MTAIGKLSREDEIRHALRGVMDPEIGRSVVDVGLIYNICIDSDGRALIEMTTTTRGCPAIGFLRDAIRERALETGVAAAVEVRLTYDPPWSPDMMAD